LAAAIIATSPPMEWPISTGGSACASIKAAMSLAKSVMETPTTFPPAP